MVAPSSTSERGPATCVTIPAVLRFRDCELSLDRVELRRRGRVVSLEPQVFDVLAYLIRHRDRVVTKQELLDEVWGSRFVSESALTSRVGSARAAVGDSGRAQAVIKTVHGKGYRFVAEIDRPTAPPSARHRQGAYRGAGQNLALRIIGGVCAGQGAAVGIAGRWGSGRTTVVEHLVDAATDAGVHVGTASPLGVDHRPFGTVIDLLDGLCVRSPQLLAGLATACRRELERCWSGEPASTRQRLLVSAQEILRAAAADGGALLAIDDVHLTDHESLDLLRQLVRLTRRHALAVVASHPSGWTVGDDFEVIELSGGREPPPDGELLHRLPPEIAGALQRVAVGGDVFDLVEFRAAAGVDEERALRMLAAASTDGAIEPWGAGYRFVGDGTAAAIVDVLPSLHQASIRRRTAAALTELDAAPDRVAAHLLAAGEIVAAAPFALRAARAAARANRHGEVLRWTETIADDVPESGELLELRADALAAGGDPTAIHAFRRALQLAPTDRAHGLKAKLAREAMIVGDLDTAEEVLAAVTSDEDTDAGVLLARAVLAYLREDVERARDLLDRARPMALSGDAPARWLDVVTLSGLIAHGRGEWFDRLHHELRATRHSGDLSTVVFDAHLCVAEYMLYGPMPYAEVIALAADLRATARRHGARRAEAFACAVIGEARLLSGDLDAAVDDLTEAVDLHRAVGSQFGEAHSLQRLAETRLALGRPREAEAIARSALPPARWSALSRCVTPRVYGTLIAAAPEPDAAVETADEAAEVLDGPADCTFCEIMVAVPTTIAYAEGGRLGDAQRHLASAERSARLWAGTTWPAAVDEARAALARAEGREQDAVRLLEGARAVFAEAGQILDAARCEEALIG